MRYRTDNNDTHVLNKRHDDDDDDNENNDNGYDSHEQRTQPRSHRRK